MRDAEKREAPAQTYQRPGREMISAERAEFVHLRDDGRLNNEVFRRLQRELDLEEATLIPD